MKKLSDILYKVNIQKVIGHTEVVFHNITFNSREVVLNDVFVAIDGSTVDGHQFIDDAVNQGALAVICEKEPDKKINGVNYIMVDDGRLALAQIAANYYDNPSKHLKLVGVTGTNGKTTVCSLLHQLFLKAGYKAGLLSTVAVKIGEEEINTHLTTPDSLTINKHLKGMVDAGATHAFMEVSSHGIDQGRTHGLHFDIAAFTNLSQDHLDYHKTFANYRDTKKQLFDQLPKQAKAIVNLDDKNGSYMLQNCIAQKMTYACQQSADYKTKIIANNISGLSLKIDEQEVHTQLVGKFNAYNITLVLAIAVQLGIDKNEVIKLISSLQSVAGRFQIYNTTQDHITAIVDYAHTPDALENVLQTITAIKTAHQSLITIIGCGGNRDKSKRPKMAKIAADFSDEVILTSDNPRNEPAQAIIEDMKTGISYELNSKVSEEVSRKKAIETACREAHAKSIILIAGKGHETYQIIKGEKHHFDDYQEVKNQLKLYHR